MKAAMKNSKQVEEEFRTRVRSRHDGFEAVHMRVQSEIHAAQRRNVFTCIPIPLRAAAALLMLSAGIVTAWMVLSRNRNLPLCPHAANVEAPPAEPAVITAIRQLNKNRVCYCSPRYSGSLRQTEQFN